MKSWRAHLERLGATWTHWTVLPLLLWPAYCILGLHEMRWEMFGLLIVVPTLAFTNAWTRKLYVGLYPIALTSVTYDAMRFVKNVGISPDNIHVCDLRAHEMALFGVGSGAGRMTLQDYFLLHRSDVADIYFAIPYGTFILVSVVFAVFLYRKSFVALQRYAWTFLFMNLAAYVTYHLYPAAPPWYYHVTHSCVADLSTHASEASHLANVDRLLGISYFRSFYGRSADVFGAVPSLHVAYPLLILVEGWVLFGPVRRALAVLFTVSMCVAAIYLDHHYVIDVILGATYAILLDLGFRYLFGRLERGKVGSPSVVSASPALDVP
jgi:membrane-associated phospholipid phosphatase